ncbi:RICIN domain-containing protein [Actinopolyspora xinjiangensis]|nr:ricin-type beta-trefoil lectin domain protein [Actinopolyspora xinjiangensis]
MMIRDGLAAVAVLAGLAVACPASAQPAAPEIYLIKSVGIPGKCLRDEGKDPQVNMRLRTCDSSDKLQQFERRPAGGDYYYYINVGSGQCLDHNGKTALYGKKCNWGEYQKWTDRDKSGSVFHLAGKTGKCIEGGGDQDSWGFVRTCKTGETKQRWQREPVKTGASESEGSWNPVLERIE